MEKVIYIQRGENLLYPKEVEAWKKSDKVNPPAWLSDRCKVLSVDEESGLFELATRKYDNGDYEYITPELNPIVKVKNDDSWICLGNISKYETNKIFSLTSKQFDLLYKKK